MSIKKGTHSGGIAMLILKLLEEKDMYGYQIIEELSIKSQNVFQLKTGTLYPLLHVLENDGMIKSYDEKTQSGRLRKYYRLTNEGIEFLEYKHSEWNLYSSAMNYIMNGNNTGQKGENYATT